MLLSRDPLYNYYALRRQRSINHHALLFADYSIFIHHPISLRKNVYKNIRVQLQKKEEERGVKNIGVGYCNAIY